MQSISLKQIKQEYIHYLECLEFGVTVFSVKFHKFDDTAKAWKAILPVTLRSNPPIKICIYPSVNQDHFVSGTMRSENVWEAGIVNIVTRCLRQDPAIELFDIGANIGQYSLRTGGMEHQVVAVEVLQRHVSMLHKSIHLNGILDKAKLIHSAVSNSRKTVSIHQTPGNYGGSYLVNSSSRVKVIRALSGSVLVESILLDDLFEVTLFKKAVMKIYIQGHEAFALLNGPKLFDSIHIPYIFMELGQLAGPHYAKTKHWQ